MGYYIGRYGKVIEEGGRRTEEVLDTSGLGFVNHFEDKERAFMFRDRLREERPRIFLRECLEESSLVKKVKKADSQDAFREKIRKRLCETEGLFWTNVGQLKPKDMVDVWIRLLQYGYSRAPEERVLDEDGKRRLLLEETTRKATLIGGGLPVAEVFEEE